MYICLLFPVEGQHEKNKIAGKCRRFPLLNSPVCIPECAGQRPKSFSLWGKAKDSKEFMQKPVKKGL